MMSENEKQMRLKLLQSLSDKLDDLGSDSLKDKYLPKDEPLSVEVAAPDKKSLAEGLDKAHDLAAGDSSDDETDDEQRMLELLGTDDSDSDEDEDKGKLGNFFHR